MAGLWHKGWRGLFGMVLVIACGMQPGARADDATDDGAGSEGRVLYRPISYYSTAGDGFSGKSTAASAVEQALLAVMSRVPEPVELRYMPLKRAISLYIASPDACVVAPRNGQEEGDLVSEVFYVNPFWIYVRADSDFHSYDDLRTFGSIDGADMIAGQVVFGQLERTFAPNFQSLIAMLLSGRVDAIPLGELALDNEPALIPRMRRLTDEPFLYLDMRIRCKPSGANSAFIKAVNEAIAAVITNGPMVP